MTVFDVALGEAVSSGASDVYFLEGVPPSIKVDGLVSPVPGVDALDAAAIRGIIERVLPVRERAVFAEHDRSVLPLHGGEQTAGFAVSRVERDELAQKLLGFGPVVHAPRGVDLAPQLVGK